jgi:hypothetical protein
LVEKVIDGDRDEDRRERWEVWCRVVGIPFPRSNTTRSWERARAREGERWGVGWVQARDEEWAARVHYAV